MAAVGEFEGVDFAEVLGAERSEVLRKLEWCVRRLQSLAGGKLAIAREARELDDRLGLTPKGRLALRMTIVETDTEATRVITTSTARRLRAVDASAAG